MEMNNKYIIDNNNNTIHETAVIFDNVELGSNNWVGAYTVIGAPAEKRGFIGRGKVVIGDGNEIREHVTIHAGTTKVTTIGNQNYIQCHSHIGHDTHVMNNCVISAYGCTGGFGIINDWANIGLAAVLHQRSTMETGSMLGAQGFGKGTLKEFTIYMGVPTKRTKPNTFLINKLGDRNGTII